MPSTTGATKAEKPKPYATLHFPKGTKAPSFDGMDVQQSVTIRITGVVTALRADEYERSFDLLPDTVEIEASEKPMSIDEALRISRRRKD